MAILAPTQTPAPTPPPLAPPLPTPTPRSPGFEALAAVAALALAAALGPRKRAR